MLVGRETEQAGIRRLVAAARVGRSGVLVLTGEAGMGKTALLDAAVEEQPEMRVLRAAGSERERDLAFAGLHQLLGPVLASVDGLPPPQREALSVALALTSGRVEHRFAVGAAVLTLLSRAADDDPLLLVLDDVHLWDSASAEALAFVARRLEVDRVALLATSREARGSPLLDADLPRLVLTGLTAAGTATLLARQATGPVDPALVDRVHQGTGGNPLAVEELSRDLDLLSRLTPDGPIPVPEVVRERFARQISVLPPEVRRTLLLAVVTEGDLALAADAGARLGWPVADLTAAEDAGLVVASAGRVGFRHPLAAASVYACAEATTRRAAHRAVAAALPPSERERRAWHLAEAGVGVDDGVAALLDDVGGGAMARSAHGVAATAFERAALFSSDPQERARRRLAAGEAAWLAGQVERALDLLSLAGTEAGSERLRADIDGLRGAVALRAGSLEEARGLLLDAADRLVEDDPDAAVGLLADGVTACMYLGDAPMALRLVKRLDAAVLRCDDEYPRLLGALAAGVAEVLAGSGGPDRIRAAVAELAARPWVEPDLRRPGWLVLGPLFLREQGSGRELARLAVEAQRERGALATLPNLLFLTSRDAATTDRWAEAAGGYEEGVSLAREAGQTTDLALCLAGLACLEARRGEGDACLRHAEEAATLAARHHVHFVAGWALAARAELALGLGDAETALTACTAQEVRLAELGLRDVDVAPGAEKAEALHRLGRRAEAREVAEAYAARAQVKGQPWAVAKGLRVLAMTGDPADAEEVFDRALQTHGDSPDVFEHARTLLALGEARRRARRPLPAREALRSALEIFGRVGAEPWGEQAARELAATGETPLRRDRSLLGQLSAQEQQIARLLGSGRTTREAAAAMFLSPKTVEYHLRHVYTKLEIHSREELAAALEAG